MNRYHKIFAMLVNPKHTSKIKLYGREIYFNNINTFGILQKNLDELKGVRKDLYMDSDCYIDAGAHIGIKSLIYHSVNPKSLCVAFEPVSITYSLLKRNTQGLDNILLFNTALGSNDCKKKIYYDKKHLDVSSLNNDHIFLNKSKNNQISEHSITTKRLDDFYSYFKNKKRIYLKIDVESYEDNVLLGSVKTLKRVKYLDIEIAQSESKVLSETLAKIGKKYNILDADFFYKGDFRKPRAVNLLLELYR